MLKEQNTEVNTRSTEVLDHETITTASNKLPSPTAKFDGEVDNNSDVSTGSLVDTIERDEKSGYLEKEKNVVIEELPVASTDDPKFSVSENITAVKSKSLHEEIIHTDVAMFSTGAVADAFFEEHDD
jgi:hypothetical protein